MWVRALELYADLARGGDGNTVLTAPPVNKSVRIHHADIDHDDSEHAESKHDEAGISHSSPSKPVVFHADRKEGHVTKIVNQSLDSDSGEAESKRSEPSPLKSRIINNPFSYDPDRETNDVQHRKRYDEHHHLVTEYSVDHGMTVFLNDGGHHTNFYF